MQPCRDRKLSELFTTEQSDLRLQLDRHQHDEEERHEGSNEVDGQACHRDGQPDDETEHKHSRPAPRNAVAALRERWVLLELFLNLSEDALFVFRQWHDPIIARRTAFLNAVLKVPGRAALLGNVSHGSQSAGTHRTGRADGGITRPTKGLFRSWEFSATGPRSDKRSAIRG